MDYEVVVERASARQLAAVRGTVPALSEIGSTIIRLLDQVWPVLRAQGTPTGRNVVVYGDWAEAAAERRTDIYFSLKPG